jgi:DNA repair exonuclease SbcCD ATPase subunit
MILDSAFEKDVTDLLIKYRGIQSSIESTKTSITDIESKLKELECEKNTLKLCKPIIDDIISKFSDSLLRKLEELLTIGLKKIFYDRDYSIQIRVVDKRNTKCVELLLNDGGNLIPVRNANVAGGVLVVIASIIQIFYIVNLPNVANQLFLDEQFSQISSQYIDTFMDFVKTLCSETGLSIVLITHDNKFMKYGDRIYVADKGHFRMQENDDLYG